MVCPGKPFQQPSISRTGPAGTGRYGDGVGVMRRRGTSEGAQAAGALQDGSGASVLDVGALPPQLAEIVRHA